MPVAQDVSQILIAVAAGLAGGAVVLGLGIAVYVFGSFLLMGAHAPRRPFGTSMREIFREMFFAGVTQPLLPLFYFVGRRMDAFLLKRASAGKTPIVFVHGYMQNRVGFLGLARALAKKGRPTSRPRPPSDRAAAMDDRAGRRRQAARKALRPPTAARAPGS